MKEDTMASRSNSKKNDERTYVVKEGDYEGLTIKIGKVPPMVMQKTMRSVKLPNRPTYETKTLSGRTEVWPMDKESAKQTENGEVLWEYYEEQLEEAKAVQNERTLSAAFLFGTECEIPEDGWDKRQIYLGIDVPTEPDARRAHFLMTELTANDIQELMLAIMANIEGSSEELIADAEASFRGAVRNGPEKA